MDGPDYTWKPRASDFDLFECPAPFDRAPIKAMAQQKELESSDVFKADTDQ